MHLINGSPQLRQYSVHVMARVHLAHNVLRKFMQALTFANSSTAASCNVMPWHSFIPLK